MIFQEKARVISNFEIGDKCYEIILEAPKIAKSAHAGQFVMVPTPTTLYNSFILLESFPATLKGRFKKGISPSEH